MINTKNLSFEIRRQPILSTAASAIAGWYQVPWVCAQGGIDMAEGSRVALARLADAELLRRCGDHPHRDSVLIHRASWHSFDAPWTEMQTAMQCAADSRSLFIELNCRGLTSSEDVKRLFMAVEAIRRAGAGVCLAGIEGSVAAKQILAVKPDLVRCFVHEATKVLSKQQEAEWLSELAAQNVPVLVSDEALSPADRHVAALLGATLYLHAKPTVAPTLPVRSGAAFRHAVIPAAIAAAMLATACSSAPPRPVTPDGTNRVPINQASRIAEFEAAAATSSASLREREELHRRVLELTSQVNKLNQALAVLANAESQSAKLESRSNLKASQRNGGMLWQGLHAEPKPNALVVREFFSTGEAAFRPSAEQARALVDAARQASAVYVRGRTDSYVADAGNRAVAAARAKAARTWLITQGIPASKVKASWEAAGDFLSENESNAGRGLNRRVELEFVGVELRTDAQASLNTSNRS